MESDFFPGLPSYAQALRYPIPAAVGLESGFCFFVLGLAVSSGEARHGRVSCVGDCGLVLKIYLFVITDTIIHPFVMTCQEVLGRISEIRRKFIANIDIMKI